MADAPFNQAQFTQDQLNQAPFTEAPGAPITNPTIATQLAHRSVRRFTDEPVTGEQIQTLFEVARRTATCSYLQQFTIIHVADQDVRHSIAQSTRQSFVDAENGELFVFVVDLYRNMRIREEAGVDNEPLQRINLFMEAVEDTLLAAQNMVVAAESMGLGTVFLGSINTDPRHVIQTLNLPKYTYPLVGLIVGHPNQEPLFKPRMPLAFTTGTNTYPYQDSYLESLAEYDQQVVAYYDARGTKCRLGSFTEMIQTKLGNGRSEQSPMLEVLHEQGLVLR